MNDMVLTVEETAEILKTSTDTIYILVKDDDFPAIKIGGKWKIVHSKLVLWLEAQCKNKHS